MDFILTRTDSRPDGIFGVLTTAGGATIAQTLERAYPDGAGGSVPKIPAGTYRCVRGQHMLDRGPPFTTFEITGVPGHTGLLFHSGNWNADSQGCVLLGEERHDDMLLASRAAFGAFMLLAGGQREFTLEVR